jgi:hypothetical protein
MKTKLLSTILPASVLSLAFAASAAFAHHSAIQFDFATEKDYTGVVKQFAAKNPHMILVMEVKDDKGATQEIQFEGHSTNNMYRNGYRKGMINVGDTVTVHVAPLKDGTPGGYVTSAVTAKGEDFGMQSRARGEATRAQAEGR